jgi:hypothetical protein
MPISTSGPMKMRKLPMKRNPKKRSCIQSDPEPIASKAPLSMLLAVPSQLVSSDPCFRTFTK